MRNRFRQEFISEIAFCINHCTAYSPSSMVRPLLIRFDKLVWDVYNGLAGGGMNNSEKKFISRLNKFIKKGDIDCDIGHHGYTMSWDEPICAQIDGTERIRSSSINYCSWLFYWIATFFYEELEDYLDFNENSATDWSSQMEYEICSGMCRVARIYLEWQHDNGKQIFRSRK